MAKNVRVRAVRRESVDIDKLVSGLMLLIEELTPQPTTEEENAEGSDKHEESIDDSAATS